MKTILVDAVNTFIIKGQGINQEMHTLLEQYPNKKIIVTNADDQQVVEFGLDQMPYEVFTMKHNPDKPDPLYFQTFMKQYGCISDDLVYFEHNPDAVQSARSLGIAAFHYDPDKKDLRTLREFLDTYV